ncbi:hypothetical protein DVH24_023189 [Malus domestica]|uniref:Uncharacterized protein n=1 Tax=Malus domestica TaxID=3750 RepID=A0A498KTJ6_MALDO|nr:hypothetical protein DVH24_023189 [Malus domestica]
MWSTVYALKRQGRTLYDAIGKSEPISEFESYGYSSFCFSGVNDEGLRLGSLECIVPCRSGMCTAPLHVTSSQLIVSVIFPVTAIKTLLYSGAVATGLAKNMTVQIWNNLLDIYNLTSAKEASPV